MNTYMQTTWGSTLKLGAVISIAAAVLGGLLVSIGGVPQVAVVIGVMVFGFTASMVASAPAVRHRHLHPTTVRVVDADRRVA